MRNQYRTAPVLVSHMKKFIYFKTTKTAGTSVEMALQPYCIPEGGKVSEQTESLESEVGIVGARGGKDFVSGQRWQNHMPARKIRDDLGPEIWQGYCKVCNIRNPWDKTVSFFHMKFPKIKKEDEKTIVGKFRSWIECASTDFDGLAVDTQFYFIGGKPVADEYIRFDNMAEGLARVCARLDLKIDKLPKTKTLPRGQNRIRYQNYYDEAGKQKVGQVYRREIEYFGWSFE